MYVYAELVGRAAANERQIGNAESAHFTADIGLDKGALNTAVALFFAFFVALQPLGAALGRRYGMVLWVPSCMLLWGVCTALHAWVRHRWQLYTLRILIGCLEGKSPIPNPQRLRRRAYDLALLVETAPNRPARSGPSQHLNIAHVSLVWLSHLRFPPTVASIPELKANVSSRILPSHRNLPLPLLHALRIRQTALVLLRSGGSWWCPWGPYKLPSVLPLRQRRWRFR